MTRSLQLYFKIQKMLVQGLAARGATGSAGSAQLQFWTFSSHCNYRIDMKISLLGSQQRCLQSARLRYGSILRVKEVTGEMERVLSASSTSSLFCRRYLNLQILQIFPLDDKKSSNKTRQTKHKEPIFAFHMGT